MSKGEAATERSQESVLADLCARVDALSPAQRLLLMRRLWALVPPGAEPAQAAPVKTSDAATGAPQLVAYYVAADGATPDPAMLRARLREQLPDHMVPSHFVSLPALPRTPNGKLDQHALPGPPAAGAGAGGASAGTENAAGGSAGSAAGMGTDGKVASPASAVVAALAQIWADVLGFATISADDNFFEVGGDSILSIQIVARARQAGLHLAADDLFQHQTIAELARVVEIRRQGTALREQSTTARRALAGPPAGSAAPLTPIQHWFFELQLADPQHWNQALLLTAEIPLEPHLLEAALRRLVQRHDALRLRFEQVDPDDCTGRGWRQEVSAPERPVQPLLGSYVLPAEPAAYTAAFAQLAAQVQGGFDLAAGCLLSAAHVQGGAGKDRLLLAVHHLAVDAIGLGVLVEELAHFYRELAAGREGQLAAQPVSYQEWALALADYAGTEEVRSELGFWTEMLATPTLPLPTDKPRPAPGGSAPGVGATESSSEVVAVAATVEETNALLQQKAAAGGSTAHELLLAALALTLCEWSQGDAVLVGLEGHGREGAHVGLDVGGSVGWFTSHYPLVLKLGPNRTPAPALQTVRAQLARLPRRGIGYGLLRYLTGEAGAVLASLPHSELLFNYLGQFDRSCSGWDFFALAEGGAGSLRSPRNRRHHLLECNAFVLHGALQLRWEYSSTLYARATIERLAARYLQYLQSLLAPVGAASAVYTPADFPEANLTQAELEDLLAGLDLSSRSER